MNIDSNTRRSLTWLLGMVGVTAFSTLLALGVTLPAWSFTTFLLLIFGAGPGEAAVLAILGRRNGNGNGK